MHAQQALVTELHPRPSLWQMVDLDALETGTEQGAYPWRWKRQHLDTGLGMLWRVWPVLRLNSGWGLGLEKDE